MVNLSQSVIVNSILVRQAGIEYLKKQTKTVTVG